MNIVRNLKNSILQIFNSGGFHIILGNFLNKFVVFFGSICIVRLLSKSDYGVLSYIENLYNFAYICAGLGISNAIIRYVVLEDDIEGKKSVFDFMIKISICFNVMLVLVCFIINHIYPHNNNFPNACFLIYIMLLMLPVQYLNDNCLTLQRAMFDNKKFAYFNFFYATIVIIGKFVGALSGSLLTLIIIGILIQVLYFILIYVSNQKKYFSNINCKTINRKQKKEIIVYSLQYMITNGIWSLFMLMDIFLLGKLVNDPIIIADYKIAYAWPANISIVCSAIGMFIAPHFIKNENNLIWVRTNFIKAFLGNFLCVLTVAIIMYVAAKPLIFIYGGEDYYNVISLMRLILIGSVINNGCRYMIANCLAAMGKIKANMLVSFFGIIAQSLINILLIPKYGIYAPAYTSIIVYAGMAIVLFIIFNKRYNIISVNNRKIC